MTLEQGDKLGPYEILASIGAGGMGKVYRARDPRLKREVAIKVLPATLTTDPEHRQRFEREAQAIAALNHPNIVTIYSVEEAGGLPFLTMEFVDGKPLANMVRRNGLSLDTFFKLAIPLADAVGAAHHRGITHRDLKPANIMITTEGRVKVLDFGLAKLREPQLPGMDLSAMPTEGLTRAGWIIGSVAYMSPEQAEGKAVDERSDIFSLGIVLYEMATGERPFKGATAMSILSSIIKDAPAPVTDLNRSLPPDLARIIRHALVKDRERRYQTAKDLHNDLEDLREMLASKEWQSGGDFRRHRSSKRSRSILFAISALAAVLFTVVLWSMRRAANGTSGSDVAAQLTVTQITSDPGLEAQPSLSPDGKWLVYVAGGSTRDIYLRGVGGNTPINLTKDSPADDSQAAFSPDGERIVFRSEREGGGLFLMGRTGDSVIRLTDAGFDPAWSPDGTQVVYAEHATDSPYFTSGFSRLWIVKVANAEKRRLTETHALQPSWSPHGQRVAYWAVNESNRIRDIFTVPAGGGRPLAVTNDPAVDANPIWAPDGKHLYFVSDRRGSLNLWRIAIDESSGKVLSAAEPVTMPSPFVFGLSISADGKRLAFTSVMSTQNVQRVDFDPINGRATGPPLAVTTGTRLWQWLDPSPDGQRVALASGPPQEHISVSRVDGGGLRQLTNDAAFDRVPLWSTDGSRIAFHSNRAGVQQIWSVRPDGSELRRLTDYPVELMMGAWSPDGSRLAAWAPTAKKIVVFDPRKPWERQTPEEVPGLEDGKEGCRPMSWSPNGVKLTCVTPSATGTFVYSFKSQGYERLADPGWAVWLDNERLLIESSDGRLLLMDSRSKKTREVLSLLPDSSSLPRLSHDARQLFFLRANDQSDIYLLNFK